MSITSVALIAVCSYFIGVIVQWLYPIFYINRREEIEDKYKEKESK